MIRSSVLGVGGVHEKTITRITRGARPALRCDLLSFRTLLTNQKAFQTLSNSRNFDATGCCLTQDLDSRHRKNPVTRFLLMRNFITNTEKKSGIIGLVNLSRFGFPRCGFERDVVVVVSLTRVFRAPHLPCRKNLLSILISVTFAKSKSLARSQLSALGSKNRLKPTFLLIIPM